MKLKLELEMGEKRPGTRWKGVLMQLVTAYNTRRMNSAVGTRCSTWQDLNL
jgi:hypothetical protein